MAGGANVFGSIHQPEHLPWLGFLDKLDQVDLFVLFDIVQFERHYFQNRNRVLTGKGPVYVTVPVSLKGHMSKELRKIEIADNPQWRRKNARTIEYAYQHAPFFEQYHADFLDVYFADYRYVVDMNKALIEWFMKAFGIETVLINASTMHDINPFEGHDSELVKNICLRVGASRYLSGPYGKEYIKEESFRGAGIDVEYHDFQHPVYEQHGAKGFFPRMCALDLLYNVGGEEGIKLIRETRRQHHGEKKTRKEEGDRE